MKPTTRDQLNDLVNYLGTLPDKFEAQNWGAKDLQRLALALQLELLQIIDYEDND
jgi:hypothetical protein